MQEAQDWDKGKKDEGDLRQAVDTRRLIFVDYGVVDEWIQS